MPNIVLGVVDKMIKIEFCLQWGANLEVKNNDCQIYYQTFIGHLLFNGYHPVLGIGDTKISKISSLLFQEYSEGK